MTLPIRLFTTRIPHHSGFSGYEQLVRFLPEMETVTVPRISNRKGFRRQVERVLRRAAASRWYMWDGIVSEWHVLRADRKSPAVSHFLYGDHTIGLLPHVRRFMKSPLVLTIHGCPSDLPEIIQYPGLMRAVDHFILLGSNQKPFFLNAGVDESRLTFIPHGVDRTFFKPDLSLKKTGNTVLMVGNWRRNFPLYKTVAERLPEVQFRIVTATYNHPFFETSAGKNITLLSGLTDEALLKEYQSADLMLLSMTDAVANNVLLEALACELPVLCERVGAVPEYLGEDYPLYFETGNAHAAVEGITKQLASPVVLKPIFSRMARFDWKEVAKETEAVYQKLW
jgi:glycosyltransferase involved in cell wall biosynthesis